MMLITHFPHFFVVLFFFFLLFFLFISGRMSLCVMKMRRARDTREGVREIGRQVQCSVYIDVASRSIERTDHKTERILIVNYVRMAVCYLQHLQTFNCYDYWKDVRTLWLWKGTHETQSQLYNPSRSEVRILKTTVQCLFAKKYAYFHYWTPFTHSQTQLLHLVSLWLSIKPLAMINGDVSFIEYPCHDLLYLLLCGQDFPSPECRFCIQQAYHHLC